MCKDKAAYPVIFNGKTISYELVVEMSALMKEPRNIAKILLALADARDILEEHTLLDPNPSIYDLLGDPRGAAMCFLAHAEAQEENK